MPGPGLQGNTSQSQDLKPVPSGSKPMLSPRSTLLTDHLWQNTFFFFKSESTSSSSGLVSLTCQLFQVSLWLTLFRTLWSYLGLHQRSTEAMKVDSLQVAESGEMQNPIYLKCQKTDEMIMIVLWNKSIWGVSGKSLCFLYVSGPHLSKGKFTKSQKSLPVPTFPLYFGPFSTIVFLSWKQKNLLEILS